MAKKFLSPPEPTYTLAPLSWQDGGNVQRASTPFGDFALFFDPVARIYRVRFRDGLIGTPVDLETAKQVAELAWRGMLCQCLTEIRATPVSPVSPPEPPEAEAVDLTDTATEA